MIYVDNDVQIRALTFYAPLFLNESPAVEDYIHLIYDTPDFYNWVVPSLTYIIHTNINTNNFTTLVSMDHLPASDGMPYESIGLGNALATQLGKDLSFVKQTLDGYEVPDQYVDNIEGKDVMLFMDIINLGNKLNSMINTVKNYGADIKGISSVWITGEHIPIYDIFTLVNKEI